MHDGACERHRLGCKPDEHTMVGLEVVRVACRWHVLQVPQKHFLHGNADKALVSWCTWNHDYTLCSFYFFYLNVQIYQIRSEKSRVRFSAWLPTDLERATLCPQRGCREHSGRTPLHGQCACREHGCLCLKYKVHFLEQCKQFVKLREVTKQLSGVTACL